MPLPVAADTQFWLSQALIAIAFLFDLLSFQLKERKQILLCFIVSASLIGAHYLLLDQITAGLILLISAVRFAVSYFTTSKVWMYLFMAAAAACLIITYHSAASLLIFTASIVATYAAFQPRDQSVRLLMMLATATLIIYNIVIRSPAATAQECFFLGSNILGYYRFYLSRRAGSA